MHHRRAGEDLKTSAARFFDLPADVVLDLPRLTLVGGAELEIENHRGLVRFSPDGVVVAFRGGELEITGSGITVGRLDRDILRMTGRFRSIVIHDDSNDRSEHG